MSRTDIKARICACKLIPVIRAQTASQACQVVAALQAGGVHVAEITMTVPGALEAMREVTATYNNSVLLGAGTVLDAETARLAILAGAKFIVSPHLDLETIKMAHRYSVCVIPGCLTPTEIMTAWSAGADFIKVFPCDAVGGVKYIKALRGPLPHVDLAPTGGVDLNTAAAFIAAGAAALGVGTALVSKELVSAGNFAELTSLARRFKEAVGAA